MRSRERFLVFLYALSIVLSLPLFYWSGFYCNNGCALLWPREFDKRYTQVFPVCAAVIITILSLSWLLANSVFLKLLYRQKYNYLEMPTAVCCSLFAGICAVIEFHHTFDYSFLHWSSKWLLAACDATILSFLHAIIAFALQ